MTAEKFKPEYVPQHLVGRVSDFQREPDGTISFFDHQVGQGLFGKDNSRATIDQDTYDYTFGPKHTNILESIPKQYGLRDAQPPKNYATIARDWIANAARDGLSYATETPGRSVATVGALGALAGGAYGLLSGEGTLDRALLYALLAGGVGAGALAGSQALHRNREAYRSSAIAGMHKSAFANTDLMSLIANNSQISDTDKKTFIAAIEGLRSSEKTELARLLRTVAGAAAGVLIARYLSGKGLIPTLIGGMLGALVGRMTGPKPIYNSLGQLSVLNLYS